MSTTSPFIPDLSANTRAWTDATVLRLRNRVLCPACWKAPLVGGVCLTCGVEVHRASSTVWEASVAAADAMVRRQAVLDALPRRAVAYAQGPARLAPAPVSPVAPTPQTAPAAPARPQSSASLQSVLAVAGAGLFAVAAAVFAFVNPELSSGSVRGWILGVVAVLFNAGAWLLAKRGLRLSAEAIGALGVVFLGLVAITVAGQFDSDWQSFLVFSAGTLVVGSVMLVAARISRMRTWLWTSLLMLATVPASLGMAFADLTGSTLFSVGGFLGGAAASSGLVVLARRLSGAFGSPLAADTTALTVLQIIMGGVGLLFVPISAFAHPDTSALVVCAAFTVGGLIALASAGHPAGRFWSLCAGLFLAVAVVALSLVVDVQEEAAPVRAAVAAGVVLVGLVVLLPLRGAVWRVGYRIGALVLAVLAAWSVVSSALLLSAAQLSPLLEQLVEPFAKSVALPMDTVLGTAATPQGSVAIALQAAALAVLSASAWAASRFARGATRRWTVTFDCLAVSLGVLSVVTALWTPVLGVASPILALVCSAAVSLALIRLPGLRRASLGVRIPVLVAAHGLAGFAAVTSWHDAAQGVAVGVGVLGCLVLAAFAMPRSVRFVHAGLAYAYALVMFAATLGLMQIDGVPQLCLTSAIGSLGAIAASFLPRLRASLWQAVLVVTTVPFVIGVVQVLFERSLWTAVSTGAMFLLALTLLVRRRDGVGSTVRVLAAAMLVPSLAVVIVCVGAVLADSGAPIVLPLVATLVAVVLAADAQLGQAIGRHLRDAATGSLCRLAIEATALLTGAIAVALALSRVSAGMPTASLVLVILAIGAAGAARFGARRYGWWLALASGSGGLWCTLGSAGVTWVEPYLLPPLLLVAAVSFVLSARGRQVRPVYATSLLIAVAAMLVLLAASGTPWPALAAWRGYGMLGAAFGLTALGAVVRRSGRPTLAQLSAPTLGAAMLAAAAGPIQAVRFGTGAEGVATGDAPVVWLCLALGVVAAVPSIVAARVLTDALPQSSAESRALGRWLLAPAVAYIPFAAWTGIRRDWTVVGVMVAVLLALLVLLVVTSARQRRGATMLPPVWFVFLLAFVTAVVAWSPRDLRVECFSIPLGLALLAAGALHMRGSAAPSNGTLNSWPAQYSGSWALLAPGITVTVAASVIATFTDPQTWRAILVMGFALVAILVGASRRLAAPFVLGIVVLPVENVFVFLVQIGRGVQAMPWWITLALVGAVLLIIAMTYERRSSGDGSITARLRDLG